ncbi:unnamed protein product [Camellia sinensis]
MRLLGYLGQWRNVAKEAVDRSMIVAKFLCLLHVTNNYLCSPTLVYGPSMLPTLNLTGDVVLAEYLSTRFGKVGLGDVILVRSPENPTRIVTKRIVGMEGDTVTFLVDPMNSDRSHILVLEQGFDKVPKGHVWIQGDNIYASKDSRHFGPVPYGLIQGKVCCRLRYGPLMASGCWHNKCNICFIYLKGNLSTLPVPYSVTPATQYHTAVEVISLEVDAPRGNSRKTHECQTQIKTLANNVT